MSAARPSATSLAGAGAVALVVAAKDEARGIGATLASITRAVDRAAREGVSIAVVVALDDTTDESEDVIRRFAGVHVVRASGGKVEAQRAGLAHARDRLGADGSFAVFCDADVLLSEDALVAVCEVMTARPDVQVATCALRPLAPRRATALARALFTYNARRGFSSARTWFNGKLFAMRAWSVPTRAEVAARVATLPPDPFYDYASGLIVDDIYLSRVVALQHGPGAIVEAPRGEVLFRAPETWRGMLRYYRRMRRELERLDVMFPETVAAHRAYGRRPTDLLAEAPVREKMHYALFQAALAGCRAAYVSERAWVRHVRRAPRGWWAPIEETKG